MNGVYYIALTANLRADKLRRHSYPLVLVIVLSLIHICFNYGAQNRYELNNMLKKSLCFAAIAGVTLVALSAVLASPLAKIFVGYDAELYEQTRHAFRIFSLCFLLAGFNIFTSSFFTALGNGAISAAVSFMRTLIFQVSSILIPVSYTHLEKLFCFIAYIAVGNIVVERLVFFCTPP